MRTGLHAVSTGRILYNITQHYPLKQVLPNMTNRYISILHVTKSFDAALDGQNRWKFYWIDLIDSACRQLGDTAFAGKLYH